MTQALMDHVALAQRTWVLHNSHDPGFREGT